MAIPKIKMTDFFKVIPKDAIRSPIPKDETDIPKDETDISSAVSEANSDISCDSIGEVIKNNKRKRLEEEIHGGFSSKRRSEEPLIKISSVKKKLGFASKESSDEVCIIEEKRPLKATSAMSLKGNEDSDEKEESSEEYEVEEIVDYQYCKSQDQGLYFVKWIGWGSEDNTWEPEANLDCAEKLAAFYKARLKQRECATPVEKRKLELPPDPRETFQIRQDFIRENCPPATKEELNEHFKKERVRKSKGPLIKIVAEPLLNGAIDQLARSKAPNEKRFKFIKDQLLAREVRDARENQQRDIRSWENEINAVDKNSAKIVVENDVDLEGAPRKMKYINQYMASEGIVIPDDPPVGCECTSCEVKTEKNCCPGMFGHSLAYTKHAKLRVEVGTPIYECNKKCACPSDCYNRVVQGGRKHKLCIYRTENGCGWGVKALENIKAGSFVVDYVGEVISDQEAEERGKKYDAEGRTYLFDLDFNLGEDNMYTVDAAFMGNLSHFVNHSCDPNMHIFNVYINCLDPNLPQICFFARREIKKGEQLTFDYCQRLSKTTDNSEDDVKNDNVLASPFSTRTPSKQLEFKTECRCGAPRCRKVLF